MTLHQENTDNSLDKKSIKDLIDKQNIEELEKTPAEEFNCSIRTASNRLLNPLTYAIILNKSNSIIKTLSSKLQALNDQYKKEGQLPLIYESLFNAIILNKYQAVKLIAELLIRNGADLNLKNQNGDSPLLFAIENGKSEIAELLIRSGADLNLSTQSGDSPLMVATKKNNLKIVELLIFSNADLNIANKNGNTALIIALKYNNLEIAELLIRSGAKLNLTNKNFDTAFKIAVKINNLKIADLLIKFGANQEHYSQQVKVHKKIIKPLKKRILFNFITGLPTIPEEAELSPSPSPYMTSLSETQKSEVLKSR